MFEIEKNVPMPPVPKDGAAKYPWRQLAVGDSFVVPADTVKRGTVSNNMNSAEKRIGGGIKFSLRVQPDGSIRVWRTA